MRSSRNVPTASFRNVLAMLTGAFVGATICWIFWGLVTPGDYFANGSPLVWPTIAAAGIAGAYAATRLRSRAFQITLATAACASLLFWLAVPDAWWATSPPKRPQRSKSAN